jgi:hypothetical protein
MKNAATEMYEMLKITGGDECLFRICVLVCMKVSENGSEREDKKIANGNTVDLMLNNEFMPEYGL